MSSMHAFTHGSSSESSENEDDFLHPSTDPQAEEFADYNPRKRRRTGRDAKESAALGVFGSESEDEGPGKRWKRKNLRGKGMQFVATGQKKVDEDEDEEDEEDEDVDMEDAPEVEENAGLRSLGMGAKGLGWQSPAPNKKSNSYSNNGTPLGKGFVPSSAAVPILKNNDDDEISTPRIARPSAFSTPNTNGKGKAAKAGPAINTGSFAARMMAKMGYKEGQGLGKEGTGRSGVIEVTLRPQGVGLGAVKEKSRQEIEEEKRQAKIKGIKYEGGSSDEERKKKRKSKPRFDSDNGSGSAMSTPRRAVQKPKYRTVEELQKAAPGLKIPDSFAPILDMTGPGQKLLTSTSGLLTPTNPAFETVEQGENRKLARRAQNDLSAFVEEWKNLEERKAYVELLITQQERDIEEEQREYDRMKQFADAVASISESVRDNQWDPVFAALKASGSTTLTSTSESSKQFEELTNVAVAAVHPFLRQATEGWNPLEDPKLDGLARQIYEIRHILGAAPDTSMSQTYLMNDGSHRIQAKSTTAFESMIYKIIFPKIVSVINQSWDAHNPTPLLSLLDAWEGLLPPFVRAQILDQVVVNKLNEAVSSWNPRRRHEKDLPHLWLFPWLQYLPSHHADPKASTGLVSDIKRKFRKLIDTWDFRKGVIPGLEKWRDVLRPNGKNDQWTPLIMNHVLPNMASFLNNPKYFVVDPQDQAPYMSALNGVLSWRDILSPRIISQIITETVFPMWHHVLHQWLTVVGPNQEIGQWFEWWRDEAFPEEIKDLKAIQDEFDTGEDMINHALDLGSKASTHLPLPSPTSKKPTQIKSSPPPPAPKPPTPAIAEEITFKHKIEDWCIENDLQLLPEKKIMHTAGPLYRITAAGNGKNGTLAYFKGDGIVAVQRKGQEFVDLSIVWENEEERDALLEMAWGGVK